MNHSKLIFATLALSLSGMAHAGDPCADLSANVNQKMQDRLRASVPKQDPTSFVQDGFDVKGILSQDVTAGFSKLMSLDFSSLATSLLNKGLQSAAQMGAAQFSNKMNGLLNTYGAPAVQISGVTGATGIGGQLLQSGANSVIGTVNNTVQNAQNSVANGASNLVTSTVTSVKVPSAASIYSNAVAR